MHLHKLSCHNLGMTQVELGKALGEGTFGTTYMGRWRGGDVAVKCVHIQQHDEAESFLREVHVLACVRHPNVMPFYGTSHHGITMLSLYLTTHTNCSTCCPSLSTASMCAKRFLVCEKGFAMHANGNWVVYVRKAKVASLSCQ